MTTDVDAPIVFFQADHAARAVIDEEGCAAAAFTAMVLGMGGLPEEEADFVLDRPLLFCTTGGSGLPLFVGIASCPAAEAQQKTAAWHRSIMWRFLQKKNRDARWDVPAFILFCL